MAINQDEAEKIIRKLESLKGDDVPSIPDFPSEEKEQEPEAQAGPGLSIFKDMPESERPEMPEMGKGINVESGIGQDGLDGMSEAELLRELVQIARNLPQEMMNLMSQD